MSLASCKNCTSSPESSSLEECEHEKSWWESSAVWISASNECISNKSPYKEGWSSLRDSGLMSSSDLMSTSSAEGGHPGVQSYRLCDKNRGSSSMAPFCLICAKAESEVPCSALSPNLEDLSHGEGHEEQALMKNKWMDCAACWYSLDMAVRRKNPLTVDGQQRSLHAGNLVCYHCGC